MSFFPKILSSRVRRHANLACIHRKTIHLRARRSYSAFRRPSVFAPRRPLTTAGHTARARYPNSRPAARRSQIGLRRRTRRGASPTSASRSHVTASSYFRCRARTSPASQPPHIFDLSGARSAAQHPQACRVHRKTIHLKFHYPPSPAPEGAKIATRSPSKEAAASTRPRSPG